MKRSKKRRLTPEQRRLIQAERAERPILKRVQACWDKATREHKALCDDPFLCYLDVPPMESSLGCREHIKRAAEELIAAPPARLKHTPGPKTHGSTRIFRREVAHIR